MVLLTNRNEVLPLGGTVARVAVVGPLADAAADMRGPWGAAADPEGPVSVVAGLRALLGESRVLHAPGTSIDGEDQGAVAAALDACDRADAVLLCLGESAAMSGEAASRAYLGLPGRQREFAEAVFRRAAGPRRPVIVILFSGRPLVIPWLAEAADAVADVVFGRVSPSGRTPVSWPRAMGQIPIFFGQRPTGRPADPGDHFTSKYLDVANGPLFPFGFGLTYGKFAYSNLRVPQGAVTLRDTLFVRVDVHNAGDRAGEETVFLFVHDRLSSVARPLLELRGFGKIRLAPRESGVVTLVLPAAELRFLGPDLEPAFEPGEVEILVGPCADRSQLLAAAIRLARP
jgi:beta-glucosidase